MLAGKPELPAVALHLRADKTDPAGQHQHIARFKAVFRQIHRQLDSVIDRRLGVHAEMPCAIKRHPAVRYGNRRGAAVLPTAAVGAKKRSVREDFFIGQIQVGQDPVNALVRVRRGTVRFPIVENQTVISPCGVQGGRRIASVRMLVHYNRHIVYSVLDGCFAVGGIGELFGIDRVDLGVSRYDIGLRVPQGIRISGFFRDGGSRRGNAVSISYGPRFHRFSVNDIRHLIGALHAGVIGVIGH